MNTSRIRFVALFVICLGITAAVSTVVIGEPPRLGTPDDRADAAVEPFGTVLGDFNGVTAYSNGNWEVSYEYNYDTGINTGMKWQCVEYVNRYYYIIYGETIRVPGDDAKDYYPNAAAHGLDPYPNGGPVGPGIGDVLCSNGTPENYGHVAIVREVHSDHLVLIHQNWSNTYADTSRVISMTFDGANYSVEDLSANYPIAGWLRSSGAGVDVVVSQQVSANATRTNPNTIYALPDEYGVDFPVEAEKNFYVNFRLMNTGASDVTLDDYGVQILKGGVHQFYLRVGSPITLSSGEEVLFDKRGWITDVRLDGGATTTFTARVQYSIGSAWYDAAGLNGIVDFQVHPRPSLANSILVKRPQPDGDPNPDLSKIYFHQWGYKWWIETATVADNLFPGWTTEFYVFPNATVDGLSTPKTPLNDFTVPILTGRNLVFKQSGVPTVYIVEPEPGTTTPLKSRPFADEAAFWSYGYSSSVTPNDLVTQTVEIDNGWSWLIGEYPVGSVIHAPADVSISQPLDIDPTRANPALVYALPNQYGGSSPDPNEKNFLAQFRLRNDGSSSITIDDYGIEVLKSGVHQFYLRRGSGVTLIPSESTPAFDTKGWITNDRLGGGIDATMFDAVIQYQIGGVWHNATGAGATASFVVYPLPELVDGMIIKRPRPEGSVDPDQIAMYRCQTGYKWEFDGETSADQLYPGWRSEFYVYDIAVVDGLDEPETPAHDLTVPLLVGRNLLFRKAGYGTVYIIEPEPSTSTPLMSRPFADAAAFWSYNYPNYPSDLISQPIVIDTGWDWLIQNYPMGSLIGEYSNDQWWDGFGAPPGGQGLDGRVYSLSTYGDDVVAGGSFYDAGGVSVSRIARWDGAAWHALGSGLSGGVIMAMTSYGGDLIAGGEFSYSGSTPVSYVAKWNGSSWSGLDSGANAPVYVLTTFDDPGAGRILVAGGYFNQAGGVSANYIAGWNGASWFPLGSGMGENVSALTEFGGDLIAGGGFTQAGGSTANYVAKWNGTAWSPLGIGLNDDVMALVAFDDPNLGSVLVAGGEFSQAGGGEANHIAMWDGANWTSMAEGFNGDVYCLAVCDGILIAAGTYSASGGTPLGKIARWNGHMWYQMGSGFDHSAWALTVKDSEVYAGGTFTLAGGDASYYVARWDGSISTGTDTPSDRIAASILENAYPNPFNPSTTIAYQLNEATEVWLHVFDVSGRLVRTLENGQRHDIGRYEVKWNGEDDQGRPVASGVYFYRFKTRSVSEAKRFVLLK